MVAMVTMTGVVVSYTNQDAETHEWHMYTHVVVCHRHLLGMFVEHNGSPLVEVAKMAWQQVSTTCALVPPSATLM